MELSGDGGNRKKVDYCWPSAGAQQMISLKSSTHSMAHFVLFGQMGRIRGGKKCSHLWRQVYKSLCALQDLRQILLLAVGRWRVHQLEAHFIHTQWNTCGITHRNLSYAIYNIMSGFHVNKQIHTISLAFFGVIPRKRYVCKVGQTKLSVKLLSEGWFTTTISIHSTVYALSKIDSVKVIIDYKFVFCTFYIVKPCEFYSA